MSLVAEYDTITTPMQIDITTGDAITPKEVFYLFKMIFEEGDIGVWTYNVETVLAEKVETILKRGEWNTRPRDFYDVFILTKTQTFEPIVFSKALNSTAAHRKSTHIFHQIDTRFDEIRQSETLKLRWIKYTRDYRYAKGITYEDVTDALKELIDYLN